MIRLLRHDTSVLREEDGAVEFRILAQMFRSEFTSSQHWSIRTWLSYLQKEGPKKRFQCCVVPYSAEPSSYLRAIQGHSGREHINPTLQDNVLLSNDFAELIYHVGSSHDMHSIIQSGLILGGKDVKKKETCGVINGREPIVHRSLSRKGFRRDTAQNCSVQKHNWKYQIQ